MRKQVVNDPRPGWSWRRVGLELVLVGVTALVVSWLRSGSMTEAAAKPPPAAVSVTETTPPMVPGPPSDYSRRVVAYIFGSTPITREELGEYLIARQGAEKLELLVNKRIIEHTCQQKGIRVEEAEIEAALAEDLKELNVNREQFVNGVLKQYKKTLYEWREDVIRPKLLMNKLCRDRVIATEEDIVNGFEAYYGEKVDCRIILWPYDEKNQVKHHLMNEIYPRIRDSEKEFDEEAKHQASPNLASAGGRIPPIGRRTTGDEVVEKEAFALQPGQISRVIETRQGLVVIKCDRRIPPNTNVKLADVRATLEKEVIEKKIQIEIKTVFDDLRKKAEPKLILARSDRMEDIRREVEKEIESAGKTPAPRGK